MLKLLRQYNQWILVVGGTLLLIAFLMPSAIQSCAQQNAVSGSLWATYAGGGEVTGGQLEEAQKELRVVELLRDQMMVGLGADKEPAYWWLLVHEAQLAGFVGGQGDGEAYAAQIAGSAKLAPNDVVKQLASMSGTNPDVVLTTLGKLQGVHRLLSLAMSVDRVSDLRLKHSIASTLLGVSGDMFVIDARTNTAVAAAAPTDEKLNEQLKKFADTPRPIATAIGKDKFGYKVADRVKLEWLAISKAAVAASVANSPELTTLALKKRFAQDPTKFGGTAIDVANFPAFEAAVRTKATDELVKARLDEIAKFTSDQLGLVQRSLKKSDGYFVLPADWTSQMPSLQALAQTIAADFGITAPAYKSSGDAWLSASDVEALEGLGKSTTEKFGSKMRMTQLVAGVKELSTPNGIAPLQVNIPSPAMTADTGDVYFFRVIAAEPSKAATDLAAVREQVEKDVLAIERFEWLDANKDAIAAAVAAEGIRPVAEKYGVAVEFPKEPIRQANPQFIGYGIRMGTQLPTLGDSPKAVAAIIEKAAKLPMIGDIAALPAAQRTIAVAVPEQLALVVIQVAEVQPVTQERFAELSGGIVTSNGAAIMNVTRDPEFAINPRELFSYDALAKRYDFKLTRSDKKKPGATDAPANSDA